MLIIIKKNIYIIIRKTINLFIIPLYVLLNVNVKLFIYKHLYLGRQIKKIH